MGGVRSSNISEVGGGVVTLIELIDREKEY